MFRLLGIRVAGTSMRRVNKFYSTSKTSNKFYSTPSKSPQRQLDWNDYFKARKSQKRWELGLGVVSSFFTLQSSTYYFLFVAKCDPTELIMGMDPSMVYVVSILASGAIGYVAGNIIATPLYRSIKSIDFIKGFDKKDNEFLSRIRKHRPQELLSVGAADNIRVLDYYGERITSVKEYRSWLRVQRDFKKTGRLPHRLGG